MNSAVAAYKAGAEIGKLTQDQLVEQHAALVKRIAYHLISRLPACVQVEDLIQSGMIGLLVTQTLKLAGCGQIIAVDLDDQKLALAQRAGTLSLSLRSLVNNGDGPIEAIRLSDMASKD